MKKIVVAILVLTLCVMHNCSAMLNPIRQNFRSLGQYARQYAQQATPTTCRTFASRANNPKNFEWLRKMRTYARNVNLPSMHTAALGLGGVGLGTAAYLQRPEFFAHVQAEEQEQQDILEQIELKLTNLSNDTTDISALQQELTDLKTKLNLLASEGTIADHEKFTSIVNKLLTLQNKNLYKQLNSYTKHINNFEAGAVNFLVATLIDKDIALANAVDDLANLPDKVELKMPDTYKNFFQSIRSNSLLKKAFLYAIDELLGKTSSISKIGATNDTLLGSVHELLNEIFSTRDTSDQVSNPLDSNRRLQNQKNLLKQISDILSAPKAIPVRYRYI